MGKTVINFNGVIESSYDSRDYKIKADSEFPEKFELPYKVSVKNQGSKPTCVAHATSSLIEYYNLAETKKYRKFSTNFIYGTRDIGYYVGDGMCIRDALKTLRKYGDCYYTDCPGNTDLQESIKVVTEDLENYRNLAYPHRIKSYYRASSIDDIKTALVHYGPVVISMTCRQGAKIVNDIYTFESGAKSAGRHCVLVVGWNEAGWIVQNSWGTSYASDGYFTLPFSFKINEAWGVVDQKDDYSLVKVKKRSKFMESVYQLFNALVNFAINFVKNVKKS